jgi:hypothetical protein
MQLSRRESMQCLRGVGGLLLAVGAVVALTRKSGSSGSTELARTLITGVPCIGLYMLSISALERPRLDTLEPWRPVLLITSLLLAPLAMLLLLRWLGADLNSGWWEALVFASTGLLAAYGCRRARVAYAALIAALLALLTWLVLWGEVLGNPSLGTVRGLLVGGGALLLAAAAALARREAIGVGELATVGGIAAILAGVVGVFAGAFVGLANGLFVTSDEGGLPHTRRGIGPIEGASGLQSFGWDLYLLLVSLALVWLAARMRVRGLGYVGAVGLLTFIVSVGLQVTRLESGHAPIHSLGGWPIVLVVVGAVALIVPAFTRDAH